MARCFQSVWPGNKCTDGAWAEVGLQCARALRLSSNGGIRVRRSIGIEADGVQRGIHNSESVVLGEERLFVHDSGLDVVIAFHDEELGMSAGVGERAKLTGRLLLKIGGAEVGEGIVTAVVIELVAANEPAEREHRRRIDKARPGRSDVVSSDLGALIRDRK